MFSVRLRTIFRLLFVMCQDLLMDVRDKLLFEPEYAGNVKEKIPPKGSLRIPWSWLPGALCLLQEVCNFLPMLCIMIM